MFRKEVYLEIKDEQVTRAEPGAADAVDAVDAALRGLSSGEQQVERGEHRRGDEHRGGISDSVSR